MAHIYGLIKLVYFITTIFVGVFFLRGDVLFGDSYQTIIRYVMPGYLILCGIMVGYIISQLRSSLQDAESAKESIAIKSLIIGSVLGLLLGIAYIVL